MNCPSCGKEIIEEKISDGTTNLQCNNCGLEIEEIPRDVLAAQEDITFPETPEIDQDVPQPDVSYNKQDNEERTHQADEFIIKPVKERLLDELTHNIVNGEIDYKLRGVEGNIVSHCPYCLEFLSKERIIANDLTYCRHCESNIRTKEVTLFNTANYVLYRFGFQYRDAYENDVRLGNNLRYDLPPLPPGTFWIAGIMIEAVISEVSVEATKRTIEKIESYFSNKTQKKKSFWRSEKEKEEPPNFSSQSHFNNEFYKIYDIVNLISSDIFIEDLMTKINNRLVVAMAFDESQLSIEEFSIAAFNMYAENLTVTETGEGRTDLDGMSPSGNTKIETLIKSQAEKLQDDPEQWGKTLSARELDYLSYLMSINSSMEDIIRDELQGLSRISLFNWITIHFAKNFTEAIEYIDETKQIRFSRFDDS